jgi:hypothetical protein
MTDRTPGTDSGGTPYDSPLTPEERLAEVLRDQKLLKATAAQDRKGLVGVRGDRGWIDGAPATSTYFQEAGLDDEDLGGRYRPGRSFDPVPAQPPNSPWADPVPIEPPYGEKVDWLPDQTTVSGEDQRGLVPWQYGPPPTEQHSAYDPNTEVVPSLPSVSAEGLTQLDTAVGLRRAFSQPQPLEPTDEET